MRYIIYKTCDGNVDLSNDDIKLMLTDTYNCIEVDDDTYWDIMENRQHLIANGLLVVKMFDENIDDNKEEKTKKSKKEIKEVK